MTGLRRYAPLAPGRGTTWPDDVRDEIRARDQGCVGPRVGMPGECLRGTEDIDHVRASGAIGMKSRSTVDNGAVLCSPHHRLKTENGRIWRPKLIAWIDEHSPHAQCVDPCSSTCPARLPAGGGAA